MAHGVSPLTLKRNTVHMLQIYVLYITCNRLSCLFGPLTRPSVYTVFAERKLLNGSHGFLKHIAGRRRGGGEGGGGVAVVWKYPLSQPGIVLATHIDFKPNVLSLSHHLRST